MKTSQIKHGAFTLIELLVVITIIAILAGIALPVYNTVTERGQQTKGLSNAKQIGLALKLFAGDNDGRFPSKTPNADGTVSPSDVDNSNDALKQLIPDYVDNETIFAVPKSVFIDQGRPDSLITNFTDRLVAGENHFAYVINLTDTSNSSFPLLADGFNNATSHTYVQAEDQEGGVWKGKKAIVIRTDNSGSLEKVNQTSMTVQGPPGTPWAADIFTNSASAQGWLGTTQTAVNPL